MERDVGVSETTRLVGGRDWAGNISCPLPIRLQEGGGGLGGRGSCPATRTFLASYVAEAGQGEPAVASAPHYTAPRPREIRDSPLFRYVSFFEILLLTKSPGKTIHMTLKQ